MEKRYRRRRRLEYRGPESTLREVRERIVGRRSHVQSEKESGITDESAIRLLLDSVEGDPFAVIHALRLFESRGEQVSSSLLGSTFEAEAGEEIATLAPPKPAAATAAWIPEEPPAEQRVAADSGGAFLVCRSGCCRVDRRERWRRPPIHEGERLKGILTVKTPGAARPAASAFSSARPISPR